MILFLGTVFHQSQILLKFNPRKGKLSYLAKWKSWNKIHYINTAHFLSKHRIIHYYYYSTANSSNTNSNQFHLSLSTILNLMAQSVKNPPAMPETWVQSLGQKIPWRRKQQPTPVILPERILGGYIQFMGSQESDTT